MVAPIQSSAASVDTQQSTDGGAPAAAPAATTPDWRSVEARALELLAKLGRADHPDAQADPIYALYQVAVDFQCSAHGYRELYLHRMRGG